jgi:hypothetical protein
MSASKIESTTNYSRFKFMDGNRPVDSGRVRKLMRSIKRKNMLQQFPVVCQKNGNGLYIMDGQHRYTAARELKVPIFFVEAKNVTIEDVAATNSAQKGWKPSDFVSSFAAQGNKEYAVLRDFIAEHGFPVSTAAALLAGKISNDGGGCCVQLGTFKVLELAMANRVAGAVKACAHYFKFAKDRSFVLAIARLLAVKGFTITRFVQKLEQQATRMVKCANWMQYAELIEEIYNHRARADDIIALTIELKKTLARKGQD